MTIPISVFWLMIVYLALVEPAWGRKLYRKLQAHQLSRETFYRITLVWQWSAAIFVVVVSLISRIPLRLLGLGNPRGFILPSGIAGTAVVGFGIGLMVSALVLVWRRRRDRGTDGRPIQSGRGGQFDALLPRTSSQRRTWMAVAFTAGIVEEVLFRGMPVYVLTHQFSRIGPVLTILATACLFGFAHAYQGWKGVLMTTVMGALFTGIYLATGALWIPMALHVLIDLRVLLMVPASETPIPTM